MLGFLKDKVNQMLKSLIYKWISQTGRDLNQVSSPNIAKLCDECISTFPGNNKRHWEELDKVLGGTETK